MASKCEFHMCLDYDTARVKNSAAPPFPPSSKGVACVRHEKLSGSQFHFLVFNLYAPRGMLTRLYTQFSFGECELMLNIENELKFSKA